MFTIKDPVGRKMLQAFPVPTEAPYRASLERRGCEPTHWHPVAHADMAEAVVHALEACWLTVVRDRWAIVRQGHGLLGAVEVNLPKDAGGLTVPAALRLCCGVRHSNDGKWAMSLLVGAVTVADGLGFILDDIPLARKHTTGADLTEAAEEAAQAFLEKAKAVTSFYERMRAIPIPRKTGPYYLAEMAEEKVMPWRLVRDATRAWIYREERPLSAWELYLAVSLAAQARSPHDQLHTLKGASAFLQHALE